MTEYKRIYEQQQILLRLKTHHQSASIPHTILYEVEENLATPAGFAWSVNYGGLGGHSLSEAKENEARAASDLLESGTLVRSFRGAGLGIDAVRIQHLEDVNWGMSDDGELHMFMLGQNNIPDYVVDLDEGHGKAIEYLRKRIDDGHALIDDRLLELSTGMKLSPIRFGRDEVLIHKRQLKM